MASHAEPQTQTTRTLRDRFNQSSLLFTGLVAIIGLAGYLIALNGLLLVRSPLLIEHTRVQNDTPTGIPVTIFRSEGRTGPPVIIAHGFSGSQQIMHSFALTLADAGYTAYTFDFPGHGLNVTPLREERGARNEQLSAALNQVVQFARPDAETPVALIGHSMGAETVIDYARANPADVEAVVAISPFFEEPPGEDIPNLLVMTGALEFGLRLPALQMIDQAAAGLGQPGQVYGDFTDGSAREVVFVPWVEHIGVLLSPVSARSALTWINQSFGREFAGQVTNRILWLVLLYLSASVLFWPFTRILRPFTGQAGERLHTGFVNWRWWVGLALIPALVTPLLLWPLLAFNLLPVNEAVPVLVGGPLALFFAMYGVFTVTGLIIQQFRTHGQAIPRLHVRRNALLIPVLALLVVGYVFLLFGVPTQFFLLNYFPPPVRLGVFAIVFVAMLPYFFADEWLTRGPETPPWAYAISKVIFLLALLLAVLLNLNSLFFLIIVAPLFVIYFVIYGMFSGRVYRRTGTFMIGALANAIIFAWIVAAVFPLVI